MPIFEKYPKLTKNSTNPVLTFGPNYQGGLLKMTNFTSRKKMKHFLKLFHNFFQFLTKMTKFAKIINFLKIWSKTQNRGPQTCKICKNTFFLTSRVTKSWSVFSFLQFFSKLKIFCTDLKKNWKKMVHFLLSLIP